MQRAQKPILGFGPVGWVAAAALIALLIPAVAGVDIQYHSIMLMNRVVGADAVLWYMSRIHVWHGLSLWAPQFNLISLMYTVIAMHVHPAALGWWRYTLVVIWAVMLPLYPLWKWLLFGPITGLLLGNSLDIVITSTAFDMATGSLLLLLVTRSSRVIAVMMIATAGANVLSVALAPPGFVTALGIPALLIATLWHLAVASSLLWWAIAARRAARIHSCRQCGYDLRGTAHLQCPECGGPIVADVDGGRKASLASPP